MRPVPPANLSIVSSTDPSPDVRSVFMGAGGATDRSFVYRARTGKSAHLRIELSRNPDLTGGILSPGVTTSEIDDCTGGEEIGGLDPLSEYFYSPLENGVRMFGPPYPRIRTFPSPGSEHPVRIVWGSCQTGPAGTPLFASVADLDPTVFLHLGDFGYPKVTDLNILRNNYKNQYNAEFLTHVVARIPRAHIFDDADFGGNRADGDLPGKENSLRAFRDYIPTYPLPGWPHGLWQTFVVGNVRIVILDLRTQREGSRPRFPDATVVPVAAEGSGGDLLRIHPSTYPAKGPKTFKGWFAEIDGTTVCRVMESTYLTNGYGECILDREVPHLSNMSTYFLRNASMLDMDQLPNGQTEWAIRTLNESALTPGETWRVLVSSGVWNPTYLGADSWGGWSNSNRMEQRFILQRLTAAAKQNTVVVSADRHVGAIDDGSHSLLPEGTAGPFNAASYSVGGQWTQGVYDRGHAFGDLFIAGNSLTMQIRDRFGDVVSAVQPLIMRAA